MKPVNQEGVVQTAQALLAVLSDENGSTPNNLVEGVVSGKSLLRAIISGQLVLCAPDVEVLDPPVGDIEATGSVEEGAA